MKNIKAFLCLTLALCALGSFVSCKNGGDGGESTAAPTENPAQTSPRETLSAEEICDKMKNGVEFGIDIEYVEPEVRLYQACAEAGGDVAVGSRYVSGVNVVNWPMGRVLMSYFASKYVQFITGIPIHDTTAGFVCYRRQVLETIDLEHIRFKGYAFQIEMKFTAYKCGFKIIEVTVIFINRELGTSKMNSSIFGEAVFGVIKLKVNSWFHKFPQKK